MPNNTKRLLFGGGARRVVVERNDESIPAIPAAGTRGPGSSGEPSGESSGASTSPFQLNQTSSFCRSSGRRESALGVAETDPRTTGGRCKSVERLIVPKTVERQGQRVRRTSGLDHQVLPLRRTSISHEYLPEVPARASPSPVNQTPGGQSGCRWHQRSGTTPGNRTAASHAYV